MDGIRPGVAHTRAVVLTAGVIVLFDELRGAAEHTYDLVYHNLGTLTPGPGWGTDLNEEVAREHPWDDKRSDW